MNIIVGDNASGESTLLEAVALALTGKVRGQRATEELTSPARHGSSPGRHRRDRALLALLAVGPGAIYSYFW